jgi:hypothetical protein
MGRRVRRHDGSSEMEKRLGVEESSKQVEFRSARFCNQSDKILDFRVGRGRRDIELAGVYVYNGKL